MKIIKKEDISHWTYKIICSGCDSELEAESSDLKRTYYAGDFRDPESESFYVVCPVCSKGNAIAESKIPKLIKIGLRK